MAALDAAAAVEEEEFAPVGSGDVSFAESSAGGADGSTLVSKEGNTIIMKGGVCYKIADTADDIPDHYAMGLAWDVTDGKKIDLDASVITLTDKLEGVEIVYFGKLKSKTGSLVHQGDEREGDDGREKRRDRARPADVERLLRDLAAAVPLLDVGVLLHVREAAHAAPRCGGARRCSEGPAEGRSGGHVRRAMRLNPEGAAVRAVAGS